MGRHTRYQGLIIQDDHVLLIRVKQISTDHEFWVIPGGGIEDSETEEECIIREIKEETNLKVVVNKLIFDEPGPKGDEYQRLKTFLCTPISGEASPGYEPEAAADASIIEVRWFALQEESTWDEDLIQDPFTYPTLVKLRKILGHKNCRSKDGQI